MKRHAEIIPIALTASELKNIHIYRTGLPASLIKKSSTNYLHQKLYINFSGTFQMSFNSIEYYHRILLRPNPLP